MFSKSSTVGPYGQAICGIPEDGALFTMVTVVLSHRSYCHASVGLHVSPHKEGHWLRFMASLCSSCKGLIKDP